MLSEDVKDQLRRVDNVEDLLSFLKDRGLDVSWEVAENLFSVTLGSNLKWVKSAGHRKAPVDAMEGLKTCIQRDGTMIVCGHNEEIIGFRIHISNYTPGAMVTEYDSISYIRSLPVPEIILPDNVSELEEECFFCCESLERIVIPNGITSIPLESFFECKKLQEVVLPDTIVSIDQGAFCGCKALQHVELPKHLKYIGAGAFFGCESLRSVVLPESLEDIGYAAFKDCTLLSDVSGSVGCKIPYERHVFDGCSSLDTSALPIDHCKIEVDKVIKELSDGLEMLSRAYLEGTNSRYFFDLRRIDPPDEDDIGSMTDDLDADFFDYLMCAIKGSWVFFRAGSLLQSNIERIENSDINYISTIITDTLRSIEAKVFHCSDEGIQKYGADYFDLRGMLFITATGKWYVLGIEWSD